MLCITLLECNLINYCKVKNDLYSFGKFAFLKYPKL